jgi:predicted RNase H-like nuclease (RuvC/YqgF family)
MGTRRRLFLFATAVVLIAGTTYSQDSPSLADLARQQRQQKASTGKDAKVPKVITNEEIPEHSGKASSSAARDGERTSDPDSASSSEPKQPAEHWKSQIVAQKNEVASLERQIDEISESIRFAPANCVANCVGWNERQREKQERVERMQAQLEEQKQRLDDLQESARKQGYGSSVYDP